MCTLPSTAREPLRAQPFSDGSNQCGVQFAETLPPKVKAPRAVSRSPQKICGYNYYLGEGFLAPPNVTRLLNNDWLKKEEYVLHRGSHFLCSCSCLLSDNDPQGSCVHLLCLIIFIFIWYYYPHPQTIPFSDRVLGFWFLFRFASHELDKIPQVESSVDTDWHAQSLNLVPELVSRDRLWVERTS